MKKILIASLLITCTAVIGHAQENEDSKKRSKSEIKIKVNKEAEPDVFIDGIKYNAAIVDLLDPDKILSVDVFKDEMAVEKYNAPNGVIVITTKNGNSKVTIESDYKYKFKVKKGKKEKGKKKDKDGPLLIINGKVVVKGELDDISPDDIEKIEVLKGDEAMKKYNAPNGVIIVTTKS